MTKKVFLDLGKQPIANRFTSEASEDEFFFNLRVVFDQDTKLVSLEEFVDLPMMFNEDYVYLSSASKTMRDHFAQTACDFQREFKPWLVMEIGSNDGVFLNNFNRKTAFSVEPCTNFANITRSKGYTTYSEFWSTELSKKIVEEKGRPDLIYSANCMCHIPDIKNAFLAIEKTIADTGVFVFEDPSLLEMLKRNSYDQVYDEHAHVFSVTALQKILESVGLEIFRVQKLDIHGGSNRIFAQKVNCRNRGIEDSVSEALQEESIFGINLKETYIEFGKRVESSKKDLLNLLESEKRKGKKIVSYGATSKSTTVFNFCGIGPDLIDYIVDTTPAKQGKFSPGVKIPVISPEEGFDDSVDCAFLGAWNFLDEITKKETEFLKRGGVFLTHVPTVSVIKQRT